MARCDSRAPIGQLRKSVFPGTGVAPAVVLGPRRTAGKPEIGTEVDHGKFGRQVGDEASTFTVGKGGENEVRIAQLISRCQSEDAIDHADELRVN